MQYDLGIAGLGLLLLVSLVFGVLAQLVVRANTSWMWLIAAAGWFVGGFVASEVIWGGATEADLQPIIDGLAFDESLLGGLIVGVVTVAVTRILVGPGRAARPTTF